VTIWSEGRIIRIACTPVGSVGSTFDSSDPRGGSFEQSAKKMPGKKAKYEDGDDADDALTTLATILTFGLLLLLHY